MIYHGEQTHDAINVKYPINDNMQFLKTQFRCVDHHVSVITNSTVPLYVVIVTAFKQWKQLTIKWNQRP